MTDKPAWTLYVEAWATPILPLVIVIARRNRTAGLLLAGLTMAAAIYIGTPYARFFALFTSGIAMAPFELTVPDIAPRWTIWLGKIAYSLYLTNWLVLVAFSRMLGTAGALVAIPFIFLAAWGLWRAVERPSIALSRRVGRPKIKPPATQWLESPPPDYEESYCACENCRHWSEDDDGDNHGSCAILLNDPVERRWRTAPTHRCGTWREACR